MIPDHAFEVLALAVAVACASPVPSFWLSHSSWPSWSCPHGQSTDRPAPVACAASRQHMQGAALGGGLVGVAQVWAGRSARLVF